MALENGHIIRIDIDDSDDPEDIIIDKKGKNTIHNVFIDPTGYHLVVSLINGDNFYLHHSFDQPKVLTKLKGHVIESIAWDEQVAEEDFENRDDFDPSVEAHVLIGTTRGVVFEHVLNSKETIFNLKDKHKQVYSIDEGSPITGIKFCRFPENFNKMWILAGTSSNGKIMEFIGKSKFEVLFQKYMETPDLQRFRQFPSELECGELQVYQEHGTIRSFSFIIQTGIAYGTIEFYEERGPGNTLLSSLSIHETAPKKPLSIIEIEHHILILYDNHYSVLSKILNEVVYVQEFPKGMIGFASDPRQKIFFAYSARRVYEITIKNEVENVWYYYLKREYFADSLRYAEEKWKHEVIYSQQAETFIQQDSYSKAAKVLAKTAQPIEEVVLRFIHRKDYEALMIYLKSKSKKLPKRRSPQRTLLSMWLVEIILHKMNENERLKISESEIQLEKQKFHIFLRENLAYFHIETVKQLLQSHGREEDLFVFSGYLGDHEYLINYYMNKEMWSEALAALKDFGKPSLIYKFAPILLCQKPALTINQLSSMDFLDIKKLLPAFVRYGLKNEGPVDFVLAYLSVIINEKKNTDRALHNYMLSLYVKQEGETELVYFITQPKIYFDIDYALRLCVKYSKRKASVYLYSLLGLHEQAVTIALEFSVDFAKEHILWAKDIDVQKRLWRIVTTHVIQVENNPSAAIALFKQNNLDIEDILPLFPDTVIIKDFKNEIIESLQVYNDNINDLKHKMDLANDRSDQINKDIEANKQKVRHIDVNQPCEICSAPVLDRSFYLFSCQHVYHQKCLFQKIKPYLDYRQLTQLKQIGSTLEDIKRNFYPAEDHPLYNELQESFDEIIASECYYCGDIMIDSITEPFTTPISKW